MRIRLMARHELPEHAVVAGRQERGQRPARRETGETKPRGASQAGQTPSRLIPGTVHRQSHRGALVVPPPTPVLRGDRPHPHSLGHCSREGQNSLSPSLQRKYTISERQKALLPAHEFRANGLIRRPDRTGSQISVKCLQISNFLAYDERLSRRSARATGTPVTLPLLRLSARCRKALPVERGQREAAAVEDC